MSGSKLYTGTIKKSQREAVVFSGHFECIFFFVGFIKKKYFGFSLNAKPRLNWLVQHFCNSFFFFFFFFTFFFEKGQLNNKRTKKSEHSCYQEPLIFNFCFPDEYFQRAKYEIRANLLRPYLILKIRFVDALITYLNTY